MIKHKKNIKAFSLIELSVVLVIISLIVGGTLTLEGGNREQKRIDTTNNRMAYLMRAIDDFVDKYQYLPCPADATQKFGSATFGIGVASGVQNTAASATCTSANIITSTSRNLKIGGIPVYTLNIAPRYVLDGWNRRITYVMDQDLAFSGTAGTNGYLDIGTQGDMSVYNFYNAVMPTELSTLDAGATQAAVLLISHGNNGHGAWGGRGGSSRINIGVADLSDEGENVHIGGSYDTEFIQSLPRPSFDDIVYYRTKQQLDGLE